MKNFAVIGPMRAGKDTVAAHFVREYGYKRVAFADAVKREVAEMLTSVADMQYTVADLDANKERFRRLLQWWGTEFRRWDDKRYWIREASKEINRLRNLNIPAVVTDARFLNELEDLQDRRFVIIEIVPDARLSQAQAHSDHASEHEWRSSAFKPDHVFNNEYGKLDDLVEKVRRVVAS